MNNKRYYPTAFALYFSFFIHGIGMVIAFAACFILYRDEETRKVSN